MGPIITGIAEVIDTILFLYMWVVIISALISWVNPDPYNSVVRTLRSLTEPVFYRVRRWLPFLMQGGLDLTPLVIILAIYFLRIALVGNLLALAHRF